MNIQKILQVLFSMLENDFLVVQFIMIIFEALRKIESKEARN